MDSIYNASHVVISADHGKTWQMGGSLDGSTDECEVVETQDGSLYMACPRPAKPCPTTATAPGAGTAD